MLFLGQRCHADPARHTSPAYLWGCAATKNPGAGPALPR